MQLDVHFVETQAKGAIDLRFTGSAGATELVLHGDPAAVDALSPMQSLAAGLAGCMAIDIVDILRKGRLPLRGLRVRLDTERAEEPPRRFVRFDMTVEVSGDVENSRVERAIDLSREKYCSVWHSLRPDTPFEVTFSVER